MSRTRTRRTSLTMLVALTALLMLPMTAGAQAATKPFNPKIFVELCEGGKFATPSTHPACKGEPVPGAVTDIRLRITQEEGEPLPADGSLRSEGFIIAAGTSGPNYDKVGEGKVSINVIEPAGLGVVSPIICMVNQNPPDPGSHATVLAVVNIGSAEPCNPKAVPAPTAIIKLQIIGSGSTFEYRLDLGGIGAGASDIKLGTPLDLDVVFYGTSEPNADVKPSTPGGQTTVQLPPEGGEYSWSGDMKDAAGTEIAMKATVAIEAPAPPPGPKSPLVPILIVVGIIAVIVVGYMIWSRSNQRKLQDWDYYDDEYGDYYDEGYDQTGYDQGYGEYADEYGQPPNR